MLYQQRLLPLPPPPAPLLTQNKKAKPNSSLTSFFTSHQRLNFGTTLKHFYTFCTETNCFSNTCFALTILYHVLKAHFFMFQHTFSSFCIMDFVCYAVFCIIFLYLTFSIFHTFSTFSTLSFTLSALSTLYNIYHRIIFVSYYLKKML